MRGKAICHFLQRQPIVMRHGLHRPLVQLHGYMVDLADGKSVKAVEPRRGGAGRPGKGQADCSLMAVAAAARALTELMKAGKEEKHAASRIGAIIGESETTIRTWRDSMLRPDADARRAPPDAIAHYCWLSSSPEFGDTPAARAEH